jgi:2-alkyl-3-oxoalkanoate reductase
MQTTGRVEPVIALTGANGFVGSGIRAWLEKKYKVICLQRNPADQRFAFELPGRIPSPDAFAAAHVTHLIHCAFDFTPYTAAEHRRNNIEPYRRLLDSARSGGVSRFILISSMSAWEHTPSLYGRTKWELEQMTTAEGGQSVRPGLVYDEEAGGLLGRMLGVLRSSSVVPLVGRGLYPQFLTHLEDLARVIDARLVQSQPGKGQVYLAAHEHCLRYRDLLRLLSDRHQLGRHWFLPVPWVLVWAMLRVLESVGLRPAFRSDSVIGLVYSNPHPFDGVEHWPGEFRSLRA